MKSKVEEDSDMPEIFFLINSHKPALLNLFLVVNLHVYKRIMYGLIPHPIMCVKPKGLDTNDSCCM